MVRAYDGDRKDPNILEQSQMLRPAVSADQATYTAARDYSKHMSWYKHKPGDKDLKVEGCRIE